jgi:hypothetical protein
LQELTSWFWFTRCWARFYTISSLHYIMEACAENNIQFASFRHQTWMELLLTDQFWKRIYSFIGMSSSFTSRNDNGEYAKMINGEILKNETQCNLKVVP